MDSVEALVVGAGVIGLACADSLSRAGREVVIIDSEPHYGTGVSSRNSEVIHSGIYYAPGSAKARLCVRGRRLLYDFCDKHNVSYRRCGKLIVATQEAQVPYLERLLESGRANGVEALRLISRAEAQQLEPALECVAAIDSASTGIIDSHAMMTALLGRAEGHGASLALQTRFASARRPATGSGFVVQLSDGDGAIDLRVEQIVIAAGLHSPSTAARIEGFPADRLPVERYAKGNYFALTGRSPFSRLIYPVPPKDGLGVHLTLDLGGQARFGPDVEWVDSPDPTVNAARMPIFYNEIRRYWRGLADGQLRPDYAGIRPKIYNSHEPAADFDIAGPEKHGLAGVVCLFGFESPGLTSALAAAEEVAGQLDC